MMPREPRKTCNSGFYHILLRGIGQQNIFEDDEDRMRIITTIARYKKELGFELHAYCLMGNHIHLLIKDVNRQLALIIKKIAGSYAYYYNWKYERVGHLFQDRFKSEPITDDIYYLAVIKYIHQNPLQAGISEVADYPWSSYAEYIAPHKNLVDSEFALNLLGGRAEFIEFVNKLSSAIEDQCLEVEYRCRISDETAIALIKEIGEVKHIHLLTQMDIQQRNKILNKLREQGLSVRQIVRLTGISRGVVQKI